VIAQTTVVGAGNTETATATIRRIDPTTRFVVLSGDDGSEMGVFCAAGVHALERTQRG